MSLYAFLLLKHALLTVHQGKTSNPDDKVSWNKFSMIWRQLWIGLNFFPIVHPIPEILYVVLTGMYCNNCTPSQKSRTRWKTDLEQD